MHNGAAIAVYQDHGLYKIWRVIPALQACWGGACCRAPSLKTGQTWSSRLIADLCGFFFWVFEASLPVGMEIQAPKQLHMKVQIGTHQYVFGGRLIFECLDPEQACGRNEASSIQSSETYEPGSVPHGVAWVATS